ncbi:MAG: A24 family peptidase [Gammaproteobacteria bacterium]|nr:A24 family peptidase [Gammaproteobacteria bacterium]
MDIAGELTGAIILGLLVGSFLNVVIYRLPIMMENDWRAQCAELTRGEADNATDDAEPFNLFTPRSRCPGCSTQITAWQNVPVISWLLLRGKCAACKAPISARYPVIEIVTGLLSGLMIWHFGANLMGAAALLFVWALIALTVIDFDHQLLPDSITLPLLWAGLLLSALAPAYDLPLPDLRSSVIGGAAGYLILWSVYWLFKLATGKEGMGYGDFKLLAAIGAWVGYQLLPVVVMLSAVVGAAVGISMIVILGRDRQVPIPFGPYLAGAGLITLLWGRQIADAYLSYAGL